MKRKPREKTMLPGVKILIAKKTLANDYDKDRNLLAHEIQEEIVKRFPQVIPPTISTIIGKISEARQQGVNPIDRPWHLGIMNSLVDYDIPYIPADSVEAILWIQNWLYKTAQKALHDKIFKKKKLSTIKGLTTIVHAVSIRQAKWISVLHRFTGDDPEFLWLASLHYSYSEIISSISDVPFDTNHIDRWLHQGKAGFLNSLSHHVLYDYDVRSDDYHETMKILNRVGYLNNEPDELKEAFNELQSRVDKIKEKNPDQDISVEDRNNILKEIQKEKYERGKRK
ncbi:hypothetical protein ACFLWR_01900 [Chloroflexota bacterium]